MSVPCHGVLCALALSGTLHVDNSVSANFSQCLFGPLQSLLAVTDCQQSHEAFHHLCHAQVLTNPKEWSRVLIQCCAIILMSPLAAFLHCLT